MVADAFQLSEDERFCRLRLIRSENVGPVTFWRLLAKFGSAKMAVDVLCRSASNTKTRRGVRLASRSSVEREWLHIEKINARLVMYGDACYPKLLAQTTAAPPLLTVRGNHACLERKAVALVGARNASTAGKRLAMQMAGQLGEAGLLVVSGLARGIDGAAHQGAIKYGTAGILAGGVGRIYPPEHQRLAENMLEDGAILSETSLMHPARAVDFPKRNRIVAGMCVGLVVIEAARRSGSRITAEQALEYDREVMAVPGFPLDPRSYTPNKLIRDGATLVRDAFDVVQALSHFREMPIGDDIQTRNQIQAGLNFAPFNSSPSDEQSRRVLSALSLTPVTLDHLVEFADIDPPTLQSILLDLEIAGRLQRHGGQKVSLVP